MKVIDRNENEIPLVLGHRGNPNKEIENTLDSFSSAINSGADGIELDVHITADGELAVIHDFNTKRVFGVDKTVEECSLAELKEISPDIPTLKAVFDSMGDIHYDIEIKAELSYDKTLISTLVQELDNYPKLHEKIIISSFNPFAMRRFSKLSNHRFPQGIIYDGPPTTIPRILQKGQGRLFFPCDFLKPKWDIAVKEKEEKKDYPIIPWTVDNRENLQSLVETKCPIIITNEPALIVKALPEVCQR